MHTQKVRSTTEAINYTQSLAAVQTLLRAGLGSIAYLRSVGLTLHTLSNSQITGTFFLKTTLLQVGFIALQEFLTYDSASIGHFTNARNESDQSFELESSQESSLGRNGNGFSIMVQAPVWDLVIINISLQTLARGYTDEADRLLNYLVYAPLSDLTILPHLSRKEYGIFDALEKRYLRSFIFAVYLVWASLIHLSVLTGAQDNKDPNKWSRIYAPFIPLVSPGV